MKLKIALLSLAAAGIVAAPVAAQAGTVASTSIGKIASLSGLGTRKSVAVKSKQKAEAGVVVLAVLGAAAAGYGVYEAVDDDKSNGS